MIPTLVFYLVRIFLCVLPVILFLVALLLLDSFKLVRARAVLLAVAAGLVAALACYWINGRLLVLTDLSIENYALALSPPVEELVKGAYVYFLIRSRRVGFLVDGAILGFGIGAGFAILENLFYLFALGLDNLLIWTIRGLGTAIMHGAATALLAIVMQFLSERFRRGPVRSFVCGLAMASLVHGLYNRFLISPLLSVATLLIVLPVLLVLVFRHSETSLRHWLGSGFDTDTHILGMINGGHFGRTPLGAYLRRLQGRFPGETVADMLCLLRLQAELSIQAKGALLLREGGYRVAPDPQARAKIEEIDYLEKSIGPTALLALQPVRQPQNRDLWQRHLLTGRYA